MELKEKYPTVHLIPQTTQLRSLMTTIRDKNTGIKEFAFYSDRIIRLIIEEALNNFPFVETTVETPVKDCFFRGARFSERLCGVSILRAGEAMEAALRAVCLGCRIGKILIQRDETTFNAKVSYVKLPTDIHDRRVLLLDPMLATGGSCLEALKILRREGVPTSHIVFVNLVAAPEGLDAVLKEFPGLCIVTAAIDECLNENKYIVPGLGDFGDRYFGTTTSYVPIVPEFE
eukprot:Lankesteria_metandrocarpae@DN4111_c0_g1_i4.p1